MVPIESLQLALIVDTPWRLVVHSMLRQAFAPCACRCCADADPCGNPLVVETVGRRKHDPSPLGDSKLARMQATCRARTRFIEMLKCYLVGSAGARANAEVLQDH